MAGGAGNGKAENVPVHGPQGKVQPSGQVLQCPRLQAIGYHCFRGEDRASAGKARANHVSAFPQQSGGALRHGNPSTAPSTASPGDADAPAARASRRAATRRRGST